jgi:3-hydroxyacyl-CoA dehydrogenase/enoyl-CoA hydratase/3-hydroxybutyryl-CoA epimerase
MSNSQATKLTDKNFDHIMRVELADDGIAVGTIDQDGRAANVIDQDMLDALEVFVERVLTDDTICGAIITSGKATFVAGADLNGIEASLRQTKKPDPETQFERNFSLSRILRRLETGGKPFACALNGIAMGGGLEIALACHYRVAADDPRLIIGLPEVQVGLLPGGGGTQRMLRLLGIFQAMPLLLEGKTIPAGKALELGLLDSAAPRDQLVNNARQWILGEPDTVALWDQEGFVVPGGTPADNPKVAEALAGGRQMLMAKTHGRYPAPIAILSCLEEGSVLPIDEALRLECKYFTELNNDPTATAMMRTLFVNKTKADKLVGRPAGPARRRITRLGLIGAGSMGAGIALCAAQKRLEVAIVDRDMESANNALHYAETKMGRLVEKGRMTQDKADSIYARIHPSDDIADLAGCELVVEAVFEDRGVKADVTKRAAKVLDADDVLATNTSGLPITGLAEAYSRPDRYIGLHFFSPADRMPLVEVIRGKQTSDETLAWALDFIQQLGKTPIIVNDSRGFYTSRFIGSFIEEGIGMIAEGVDPALVEDCAVKLGMPMGPLSISDEIGLDLSAQSGEQMQADLGDEYEPGRAFPVISRLVDAGRHGRKNGKGFYDYADDGSKTAWPRLAELYPLQAEQPSAEDVQDRILYVQVIEALRCMQEGVLTTPADGDIGAVLGVGFPVWTGGPFSYFDRVGASDFVATCDRLAKYGEHLAAPALAREMAETNRRFYE